MFKNDLEVFLAGGMYRIECLPYAGGKILLGIADYLFSLSQSERFGASYWNRLVA